MTRKLDPADEKRARELGASKWQVLKWRTRGMPPAWKLKLLEATLNADRAPAAEPERVAS